MLINTFVNSAEQVDMCMGSEHIEEILIEPRLLSRRGSLSMTQALAIATYARVKGLKAVLVWDILMTEALMRDCLQLLESIDLSVFNAIRVCDLGALEWVSESLLKIGIQLNCESLSNNLGAIQGWCEYVRNKKGSYPERVLLSLELSESTLCDYCHVLSVPCEYLGAGGIEIFYSARHLLSPNFLPAEDNDIIHVIVSSPDSGDRPLRCIETCHGTLLYLDKDQLVLDHSEGLKKAGLHTLRIDLRDHSWEPGIDFYANGTQEGFSSKIPWPRPTHAPFFNGNESTRYFKELRTARVRALKKHCIAEVIAGEKNVFVAFKFREETSLHESFCLMNSHGEEYFRGKMLFQNSTGENVQKAERGALLISAWVPGTQAGAILSRTALGTEP